LWQKINDVFDKRLCVFHVNRMRGVFDRDKRAVGDHVCKALAHAEREQQIVRARDDERVRANPRKIVGRIECRDRVNLILECRRALRIRIRKRY